MNPYKQMNNSQLEQLYKKLREIDENRRFRKTIDKNQITLEECIKKAEIVKK